MRTSESIKEIAAALNSFQSQVSGAKKKAANPFYKSKYANLEEVINCAKDAMSDTGLSISQFPVTQDGKAGVNSILMHISGEFIESTLLLACTKQDPQAYGSAITYARRYAYQSILGIPSEDDDGNIASKPTFTAPKKATPEAPAKTTPNFTAAFALCSDLAALEVKFNSAGCQKFKSDVDMITAYGKRKQELS